ILSDLQGAWQHLRDLVAENAGFDGWDRALFHIDEAMSWETVRNLQLMGPLLLIIKNIVQQANVPDDIPDCVDDIHNILRKIHLDEGRL
ncbi:MAG: hypothetical protein ACPGRX_09240, partial [Bdellovibrionales bacterium]